MITDNDIVKLKSVFATKEDLDKFATKEDLEKHEIRTGECFAENEVRFSRIEKKLDNLEGRFDNLEGKFDDLKNQVLTIEDHIIGELKNMRTELLIASSHRREIDDHEERITRIENLVLAN